MQLSVRQANEMFGQPKGAFAYVQAADGQTYLCIEYNAAYLELTGLPLTLAQRGGGVLESMTEEDLVLDLNVDSVWIRRESEALHRTVRDVGIGSSRGQVLNAFLNLSDKYTDSVRRRQDQKR